MESGNYLSRLSNCIDLLKVLYYIVVHIYYDRPRNNNTPAGILSTCIHENPH